MITRVVHGWRVAGLIVYLMGPGRAQEHVDPRVIASWDGRDASWQATVTGSPDGGGDLGPLVRAMRAPALAAGLAEHNRDGKQGFVWHCSVRVAPGDRVLSDFEWAGVARELLDGSGVAVRGDAGGPRWLAIRHAEDHIHIAAVLVRQDTSRRFWPSFDHRRLRVTANRIERRLGLTLTASADGTAARAPGRAEIEKARRSGLGPARVELAGAVRLAAIAATDVASFVTGVEGAGYLVRVRRAPSGDPLGYTVARPGDRDPAGAPVFYSGSKLAPDLSLPRLMRAWEGVGPTAADAADPWDAARRGAGRARSVVGAARRGGKHAGVDDVVHATRDLLDAVGGRVPELRGVVDEFDRASRPPRGVAARPSRHGVELRRVARQLLWQRRVLGRMGLVGGDDAGPAVIALVTALVALVREIGAWQRERGRVHQAAAAAAAGGGLDKWLGHRGRVHAVPEGAAARGRARERRGRGTDHGVVHR